MFASDHVLRRENIDRESFKARTRTIKHGGGGGGGELDEDKEDKEEK